MYLNTSRTAARRSVSPARRSLWVALYATALTALATLPAAPPAQAVLLRLP
jgi:hypothetical protein